VLPKLTLLGASVSSYSVMLVLALGAGLVLGYERARRDGLSGRRFVAVGIAAALAGVAGARAWSLLIELLPTGGEVSIETATASSGLGVFGGLLGGSAVAALLAKKLGLRRTAWLDAAAPGAALGIAVGRIGCLLVGCCFGHPTLFPIALVFEDFDTAARPIGVPLHATQVYESLGALVPAVILFHVSAPRAGARVAAFVAGYGLLRAAVELLRADYRGRWLGTSTTMVAALLAAAIGTGLVLTLWRRGRGVDGPGATSRTPARRPS